MSKRIINEEKLKKVSGGRLYGQTRRKQRGRSAPSAPKPGDPLGSSHRKQRGRTAPNRAISE